jgi:hypothetical protein
MKYQSANILQDFEFHDAYFKFMKFENNALIVSVDYLNIHKNTEQNPYSTDMEIEVAYITFQGFCAKSFELGRKWEQDATGKMYTKEPQVIFEGQTAEDKLLNELRVGATVFEIGKLENGNYYFEGTGDEPWFQVQFSFDSVTLEWDEYRKSAWYEEQPLEK